MERTRGRTVRWWLRGYGPLAVLIAAFVLMVTLVPSVAPTAGSAGGAPGTPSGARTSSGIPIAPGVSACAGQADQVPGDGYSPPCISFAGSNGGATSAGVTGSTITVTYRLTADAGNLESTLAAFGGHVAGLAGTPADTVRTLNGLVDYFNKHFQFYGRKLKLVPYNGTGSTLTELLGGDQTQADADALTASQVDHAFADMSASTQPYAEALSRDKVVNIGAPYLSASWFDQRSPYAWSITPDCTTIALDSDLYAEARIGSGPARYAGGDLKGKPRTLAVIYPDMPQYQQCAKAGLAALKGVHVKLVESYTLDLSTLSAQATSIATKLAADHITTVSCFCDPFFPDFLTKQAAALNYTPEWLVAGTAFMDTDIAGQIYDQGEWSHAFGATPLAPQGNPADGPGYRAYLSVASGTPVLLVDTLFYQLYFLALGIELAGPDLTPQSFAGGLYAYRGGTGSAGPWKVRPGTHSPENGTREIWWDPNAVSAFDGAKGAYVAASPFYVGGRIPPGPPPVGVHYTGPLNR